MPRLVFIATLLTAGAAVAAPATGLKNPFATGREPASSTPANVDSDLKDPFAGAEGSATDLKNPWDRPGEPRDPFAARPAGEPPASPAPVRDGVVDPWARRAASEQPAGAPASAPVAENSHGLVDPWARPPGQRPTAADPPTPTSDLKNPFEAAPARGGVVDPWTRPATQRPRRPAAH